MAEEGKYTCRLDIYLHNNKCIYDSAQFKWAVRIDTFYLDEEQVNFTTVTIDEFWKILFDQNFRFLLVWNLFPT